MKSLIICAFVAALASGVLSDMRDDFVKIHKTCLDETKLSEADFKSFMQNGMKASDAKDNIKCHMKCVLEKQGLLKGGIYDDAAAIAALKQIPNMREHQAEIEKAVASCKNEKGANDCDTAFKITMCIKDKKLEITDN